MKTEIVLGAIIMLVVIAIEAALIFFPHANLAPELLGRVMGTFDGLAIIIGGYIWGSSAGSKAKTEILATQKNPQSQLQQGETS